MNFNSKLWQRYVDAVTKKSRVIQSTFGFLIMVTVELLMARWNY